MNDSPTTDKAKTRFRITESDTPPLVGEKEVGALLESSLKKWHAPNKQEAKRIASILDAEFPDDYGPDVYWKGASHHDFRGFFSWGHDHDFGWGVTRTGAMGPRHLEIVGECLSYGFLPQNLDGLNVLDVGCWSGGDVLLLKGLGAEVTAVEENEKSAASAKKLCELVGCSTEILIDSIYNDQEEWASSFDIVYASGVIYHVTDPLLFARILFCYLKPGGKLILETKSSPGNGSHCSYSGTVEHGWNWFAPTPEALGRWMVDVGFPPESIVVHVRNNGRLLSVATKQEAMALPETAGFSRPNSWLERVA